MVARVLSTLPPGDELPWQRVMRSHGRHLIIAFPAGSASAKRQARKLRAEGVEVDARGRVVRANFGWQSES
ncbi:MAG: alkylated DNA nucleotide flippase Atl1 [Planctomycetota bacterium]|jgi:alkylated DNA nucleotide flippase Atl1